MPPALDQNGELQQNFTFDPGGGGDVVVVRAFYAWPVLTPNLGLGLHNMNGNKRLIAASAAFRNEPF